MVLFKQELLNKSWTSPLVLFSYEKASNSSIFATQCLSKMSQGLEKVQVVQEQPSSGAEVPERAVEQVGAAGKFEEPSNTQSGPVGNGLFGWFAAASSVVSTSKNKAEMIELDSFKPEAPKAQPAKEVGKITSVLPEPGLVSWLTGYSSGVKITEQLSNSKEENHEAEIVSKTLSIDDSSNDDSNAVKVLPKQEYSKVREYSSSPLLDNVDIKWVVSNGPSPIVEETGAEEATQEFAAKDKVEAVETSAKGTQKILENDENVETMNTKTVEKLKVPDREEPLAAEINPWTETVATVVDNEPSFQETKLWKDSNGLDVALENMVAQLESNYARNQDVFQVDKEMVLKRDIVELKEVSLSHSEEKNTESVEVVAQNHADKNSLVSSTKDLEIDTEKTSVQDSTESVIDSEELAESNSLLKQEKKSVSSRFASLRSMFERKEPLQVNLSKPKSRASGGPVLAASAVTTNVFRTNPILDEVLYGLNSLIENNPTVTVLDVQNFPLTTNQALALAHGIAVNNHVKTLNLVNANIQTAAAVQIAKSLAANKSLLKLDLESNQIGPLGMRELATSLKFNSTLQFLNLGHQKSNTITGQEAEEEFASALEVNETLLDLKLSFRNAACRVRVNRAITRNKEKQRLARKLKQ